MSEAKTYRLVERVRRFFYETAFDAIFIMASRLRESDRKAIAKMLWHSSKNPPIKPLEDVKPETWRTIQLEQASVIPFQFCAHANEVPTACPCASNCACRKQGSCQ